MIAIDVVVAHEVIDHRGAAVEQHLARRLELRVGGVAALPAQRNLRHRQSVQRRIAAIHGDDRERQVAQAALGEQAPPSPS